MPLNWEISDTEAPTKVGASCYGNGDEPLLRLTLWPHRSLPPTGFVWFISITSVMFTLPLLALLGTQALWGLLPFLLSALALVWYFLRRSTRDGTLRETLTLWNDHVALIRTNPRKSDQKWHANPHWVEIKIRPEGGPVENYITLRGNQRTVEIGAFLSPEERQELYGLLCRWIK